MYLIEFYRNDRTMGVKPWSGDLGSAKEHAVGYLTVHNATHAVVIDEETRQKVFTYPDAGDSPAPHSRA